MTKCNRAQRILRNEQNLELIGKDDKEEWEDEIKKAYFPEECEDFEFADRNSKCWVNLKNKPNVIFNTTHSTLSALRYEGNINNLPFQITPDQVGTIIDCGSNNLGNEECGGIKGNLAGKGKIGFFVRQDAQNFEWRRRERGGSTLWFLSTEPGSQMSKAMAHSSAVLGDPTFLSFSMGLTYKGKFSSEEIRDNYFLTDGGFVENLGLLSLVERGTDLIVLSDMGYPERVGDDLQLAIDQVHKLLKCDVTGKEDMKAANVVTTLRYSCPDAQKNKGTKEGTILYVRPYLENIKDFKDQLKTKQPELYACIEEKTHKCYGEKPKPFKTPNKDAPLENEHQFPLTDTMLVHYDDRLIRSYYLLGKFIGENLVGPEIQGWLSSSPQ